MIARFLADHFMELKLCMSALRDVLWLVHSTISLLNRSNFVSEPQKTHVYLAHINAGCVFRCYDCRRFDWICIRFIGCSLGNFCNFSLVDGAPSET